ncbi:DUF4864 domain-containing protein [Thalassobaculum sp.]|uniref:DUF4864 domain-containing protein n=1 Tax=Thalassobaculum sp. TaxID=2022740 RepID=UPI0032F01EA3
MTTRFADIRFAVSLALCWLLLALAGSLTAAARADDGADFQAVISAQVEAFRRDDWTAAFGFASPGVRAQFGSVERFRQMVLDGYRPVARPRVFEYEPATVVDGRPTQPVFVVGPDGIAHRALYFMERQPDGSWRIGGCVLLPVADRTT